MDKIIKTLNNWQEIKEVSESLSETQKGDLFERLTQLYLKVTPKYISILKEVYLIKDREVPTELTSYLNLPGDQAGIDLIGVTYDGEYWAIQSKYRKNESKILGLEEASNFPFIAFEECRNINYGLLCTNCDSISTHLEIPQIGVLKGDIWSDLDNEFFDKVRKYLDHEPVTFEPTKPREYQKSAIQEGFRHYQLEGNSRGKLLLPCSTGKTFIGYWLAEELGANHILVAVPGLQLLNESIEKWIYEKTANGEKADWLAVCSDKDIKEIEDNDSLTSISELGVQSKANVDEISQWLKKSKSKTKIIFTTYISSPSFAQAAKINQLKIDLAILDEAHRTTGPISQTSYPYLLDDRNININKRIFMTATERHYQGESTEVYSMNDPKVYGETFYEMSYSEALKNPEVKICDYRPLLMKVNRSDIEKMLNHKAFVKPENAEWDEVLTSVDLASLIALRKAINSYDLKHTISFHRSRGRAKSYSYYQTVINNQFPEYKKIDIFHLSGSSSNKTRNKTLKEFKNSKRALVTNPRCLGEGVDIDLIDSICFADPKRSRIDIVQAIGRALRHYEGKTMSYIVIPVLCDETTTIEEYMNTDYREVLMVIRHIASFDSRIIEYFKTLSQGKSESRGEGDSYEIIGLDVNVKDFDKALAVQIFNDIGKLAWRPFEEAREFVRSLNLKNSEEWDLYVKDKLEGIPKKPADIPADPRVVYRDKGWINLGDWLGTFYIHCREREYRPFEKAREFIRNLGITSESQWRLYMKGELPNKDNKPADIPSDPNHVYKEKGWINWGDWLGTGNVHGRDRVYLSFEEAREFAHSLNLKSGGDWERLCAGKIDNKEIHPDIPKAPEYQYKNKGWNGWGDFLGTGRIAPQKRKYYPFEECREKVRLMGFRIMKDYSNFVTNELKEKGEIRCKFPSNPDKYYEDEGWISSGDFLGTGRIADKYKEFLDYEAAKAYAQRKSFLHGSEWKKFCDGEMPEKGILPLNIPKAPQIYYDPKKNKKYKGNGTWEGWSKFLGNDRKGPEHIVNKYKLLPIMSMKEIQQSELISYKDLMSNFTALKKYIEKGLIEPVGRVKTNRGVSLVFHPQDVDKLNDKVKKTNSVALLSNWLETYECLKRFRDEFPKRWPQQGEKYEDITLGQWCTTQRSMKKENRIATEREMLLNAIGFPWTLKKANYRFEEMLSRAQEFFKINGNLNASVKSKNESEVLLAKDLNHFRYRRRSSSNSLGPSKVKILDELGMNWLYEGETLIDTDGLLAERDFSKYCDRSETYIFRLRKKGEITPKGFALKGNKLIAFYHPEQRDELENR